MGLDLGGRQCERRRHVYLVDANGRKIAAIWGGAREKEAPADLIIPAGQRNAEGAIPVSTEKRRDPLITELLGRVPDAGADWPIDERLKWFRAMISAIDLCYARPNEDRELALVVRSALPPAKDD